MNNTVFARFGYRHLLQTPFFSALWITRQHLPIKVHTDKPVS
jgi:hypothetical protein